MKQTASFVITRVHRDDLKEVFPESMHEAIDALTDAEMETIARGMHEADLAGDFWYRLEQVAEEILAG